MMQPLPTASIPVRKRRRPASSPSPTPAMRKGAAAEKMAANFLTQQGLTLLAQNFCCKAGEIDLIFDEKGTIVFVEVRHRSRAHYGSACDTVTWHKQSKIIKAATLFLLKQGWYNKKTSRFDVVAINGPLNASPSIEWIRQAFC